MMLKLSNRVGTLRTIVSILLLQTFASSIVHALPRQPLPPFPERALNSWRFDSESTWGGPLSPPLALLGTRVEEGGSGYALRALKALKPLLDFVLDIQTLQVNAALSASEGNFDEAVANLSDAGALVANVVKEVVVYVQQYDATNTAYNRGRLQGRVMFEALSLVVGEIKILQAGQITKITKTVLLAKLRNSASVQGDAKALAAVQEAESCVSRKATVFTRLRALEHDYWQYGGEMSPANAKKFTRAEGFSFDIGRDSLFNNARSAVIIGSRDLRNGQVNRVLLAEEIQHGLDRPLRQASRSRWRGLSLEAFHAEVFERVLAGHAQGRFQFLTAEDIQGIQRLIIDLNQ